MLKRIKNNFDSSIEKIKWFSTLLSERLKIEFSIIKLLQDREKKEKDRAEKMKLIGERVFELRDQTDKSILNDKIVMDSISEIEKLDAEIEGIKEKTTEISKVEV